MSDLSRALQWRHRAEELRTIGEGLRSDTARESLLKLATDLDQMTDRSERQVRDDQTLVSDPTTSTP